MRSPGPLDGSRLATRFLLRDSEDDWRNVAARLAAIPSMFASWRASLDAGLGQGLPAARR